MKKLSIIVALAICTIHVKAQVVYDYLKSADAYFAKGDYNSAATYYELYLNIKNAKSIKKDAYSPYAAKSVSTKPKVSVSSRQQAIYKLAESYRLLNFPVKSEPYYAEAAAFEGADFALASYWDGKALRSLGKYKEADSVLSRFLAYYTGNDLYKDDAQRELKNLRFIQGQVVKADLKLYTVTKVPSMINAEGASYAPVWVNKNTLAFTSTRPEDANAPKKTYTNKVYLASYSDGVVSSVEKTNLAQPTDAHQGVVSFTPDGNTVYLTRWVIGKGKKSSAMYISKKESGAWAAPVMLDSSFNVGNTQEPFIMPDSKHLIFSSDRAGGYGGFDLWSVELDATGKIVGQPTNLGPTVNTKYDERAPYYHAPTATLVFSSNGNTGMGGFDFFASKGNIGSWSTPENLGYPLNSSKDDIYFASNGNEKNMLSDVLFSSDRESACCLEMFTLSKVRPLKQVSGLVVDCETNAPIQWVNLYVTNEAGQVVESRSTDANGHYNFQLDEFMNLNITAKAEGYYDGTIAAKAEANNQLVSQEVQTICLKKIKFDTVPPPPLIDTVVVMNNINFEFDRAVILPQSYEYIDAKILKMLYMYPTMTLEISGHTDDMGSAAYNLDLSQQRANAVKFYLQAKGIAPERLTAIGFGETKPLAPNQVNGKDNPEGRKLNRRTEFKVLHY
jgi:outer membrane protein OmpA-like peptidoglycan-associated protein